MFKVIIVLTFCVVYGVVSFPTVLFSRPVVVQEAKNSPLPGIANLAEKSLEHIETTSSVSGSHAQLPLPGTRNNAERIQIEPARFRGNENLAEKAIPEAVIARLAQRRES